MINSKDRGNRGSSTQKSLLLLHLAKALSPVLMEMMVLAMEVRNPNSVHFLERICIEPCFQLLKMTTRVT